MESFDLVWIDIALKGRRLAAFSLRRCFPFFLDLMSAFGGKADISGRQSDVCF
jgi:hypothetical protein